MTIEFERRRHKRFKYEAIVSHDIMSLEITHTGIVHNIGDGGIYFESNQTIYQGEEIYIWTGSDPHLSDSDTQVLLSVEIIWQKESLGSSLKYGYGAKIIKSNAIFEKIINDNKAIVDKPNQKIKKKGRAIVGAFLKDHGITWTPAVFIYIFLVSFLLYKVFDFHSAISSPWPTEDIATSKSGVVRAKVSHKEAEPTNQYDIQQFTEKKFTVHFSRNSNELSYEAHQTLIDISRFINQNPQSKIIIEGYTDSRGKPQRNKNLSKVRADSVKDYLIDMGADPENITSIGHGSQNFLASNETAKGRRLNRRVEITVGFLN